MKDRSNKMYNVLLVEDNPDHMELISSELKSSNNIQNLYIFSDGHDALNFLFGSYNRDENESNDLDFILLDLDIPKINGFEFIKLVKNHPVFNQIPIIVLTSSWRFEDKIQAIKLGANGYLIKNFDSKHLVKNIIKLIDN